MGLSPHDGFYASESFQSSPGSKKVDVTTSSRSSKSQTPFGSGAAACVKPPVLGRAQRVLQRDQDNYENSSSNNSSKAKKTPAKFMSAKKDFAVDLLSDTEKENTHATSAPPTRKKKAWTASVSKVLDHVAKLEEKGQPRRAMDMLLALLEQRQDDLDKTEKIQVHSRIAAIADNLKMIPS